MYDSTTAVPQPEVDSPTRKYGFNLINGNLVTEPPLTTVQPYTYKLQDSTTEKPTVKKYGYDFVNNGPPPAGYSTTVSPKPYTYKVYDPPSTSVPSKEYSYNILNDTPSTSVPSKEYSYKIKDTPSTSVPYKEYTYKVNDAPATTVQPKILPSQKYGYNFLEGRLEYESPKAKKYGYNVLDGAITNKETKPEIQPDKYAYKLYGTPPSTTVPPKKSPKSHGKN